MASIFRVWLTAAASYSRGSSGISTVRAVPTALPDSSPLARPLRARMISPPAPRRRVDFDLLGIATVSRGQRGTDPLDQCTDLVSFRCREVVLLVLSEQGDEVQSASLEIVDVADPERSALAPGPGR